MPRRLSRGGGCLHHVTKPTFELSICLPQPFMVPRQLSVMANPIMYGTSCGTSPAAVATTSSSEEYSRA